MKFLPDTHRVGKIVKSNSTEYFVWDELNCNYIDNTLNGPGITVMVVNPTTKYLYSYEYPSYEKFLKPNKFIHMHGICPGSVVTDQLPLFHVYQTYPYWRKMYSNGEFDHYIMMLVGISLLDYRHRYNMPVCLDESQSKTVQHLSKLYSMSGIAPDPLNIKINNEDEEHDYDLWGIEFLYDEIELIKDSYCYLGECLSRYEIDNAIKGRKDLPRFWDQRELKSLDLSEIVCNNQMVLF